MKKYIEKFKALPADKKALLLVSSLFLISAIIYCVTNLPGNSDNPTNTFTPAAPINKTASMPKVDVSIKSIKVINKKKLATKVILPPEVVNDEKKEVVATADVKPSKGGSEVVAVIDKETGNTELMIKEKPVPLFGFQNEFKIGVGYGISTSGQSAAIYGEYIPFRIGKVTVGTRAEVNTTNYRNPEAKATVVIEYRP